MFTNHTKRKRQDAYNCRNIRFRTRPICQRSVSQSSSVVTRPVVGLSVLARLHPKDAILCSINYGSKTQALSGALHQKMVVNALANAAASSAGTTRSALRNVSFPISMATICGLACSRSSSTQALMLLKDKSGIPDLGALGFYPLIHPP